MEAGEDLTTGRRIETRVRAWGRQGDRCRLGWGHGQDQEEEGPGILAETPTLEMAMVDVRKLDYNFGS